MEMHWNWFIIIYLFLGGLGAGAYLTSFAAEKEWLGKNCTLKRTGYYIAAPIVALGTVLLVFDLEQGLTKPWLLTNLLSNSSSVMTLGVYILSAFIIIGLLKGYFTFQNKPVNSALTLAGAVLALATAAYTGLLLAVVTAIPLWNTGVMPVLFVISALSTGLALTSLLTPLIEKTRASKEREIAAHLILMGTELIVIAIFLTIMISGAKGAAGQESVSLLLSGTYAAAFWLNFIGMGLLFPVVVLSVQQLRSIQATKQFPGTIAGEVATVHEGQHSYMMILTDIFVLIGGFALRALIILAALPIWDGYTIL